ncbi:MAG: hypothetical protein MUC92_01335 [Fimbriimonadaceae bacterium]|jgi:hypothetical protein|nr:hypothetical protein [Fimbriimonadaceae bacterium]
MISTLAFFAVAQAASPAASTYSLRWRPVNRDTLRYEATIDVEQDGKSVQMVSEVDYEVVSISQETMTLRVTNRAKFIRSGADEISSPDRTTYFSRHRLDGSLIDLDDKNAASTTRSAFMNRFVAPPQAVAVGGFWSLERKGGSPPGTPPAKITFTLESVSFEKATVKVNYEEIGASPNRKARGTWIVDLKTGTPEMMRLEVENIFAAGTKGVITLKKIS